MRHCGSKASVMATTSGKPLASCWRCWRTASAGELLASYWRCSLLWVMVMVMSVMGYGLWPASWLPLLTSCCRCRPDILISNSPVLCAIMPSRQ